MSTISMREDQPVETAADGAVGTDGPGQRREPDAQLLAQWSTRGDRVALAELMDRHAGAAYAVALRVTGHASDAEDAVQEGVLAVMLHARDYRPRPGASVRSWMLTITAHAARRLGRGARRRSRRERSHGADLLAQPPAPQPELAEEVWAALGELPAAMREAVLLRHADELSIADIVAALGRKEKTVRSQIERGLEHLRLALARRGRPQAPRALAALVGLSGPARISTQLRERLDRLVHTHTATAAAAGALTWTPILAVGAGLLALILSGVEWSSHRGPPAPAAPEHRSQQVATLAAPAARADAVPPIAGQPGGGIACGDDVLGRVLDQDGRACDAGPAIVDEHRPADWTPLAGERPLLSAPPWSTGIKAVDWCAPLVRGGRITLCGGLGVGRVVLTLELAERMRRSGGRTILVGADQAGSGARDLLKDMRPLPVLAGVCLVWVQGHVPADADMQRAARTASIIAGTWRDAGHDVLVVTSFPRPLADGLPVLAAVAGIRGGHAVTLVESRPFSEALPDGPLPERCDARVVMDNLPEANGDYPLIDPLRSASRLEDGDPSHERIRASAMAAIAQLRTRARTVGATALMEPQLAIGARIHAYLTQPFFVTVRFTGLPGCTVTQEQLWSDLDRLLHGACADAPAARLRYRGALPNP